MKVLLTGPFGNLGSHTLQELIRQGHSVRCFGRKTIKNGKQAQKIHGKAEIVWGDLRNSQAVAAAVEGIETIVHLGYIIPPGLEEDPQIAEDVNVGGTRHLLEAAKNQEQQPRFFFSSSFDVYGYTQHQEPPRKVTDPLQATDDYTRHKIQCEELIQSSGLTWSIFRFVDMPPLEARKPHPIMFTIPLAQRFEMLHPTDAALAIANGIRSDIWEKIWQIGGGASCQVRYEDYLHSMLERAGIGRLPEEAFGPGPYCTDWIDSSESQALLNYQRHTFEEIINEVAAASDPGPVGKLAVRLGRPLIRRSILKMSPYLGK